MSDKPVVGSIVFNPAPDAAGPSISMHTQTVMMSYGVQTPQTLRDHLDKLERELAETKAREERLTACLKKANDQAEHFERNWYLRGHEIERLRTHIQEAADRAQESLDLCIEDKQQPMTIESFRNRRDWHLAALQQKGDTNADA